MNASPNADKLDVVAGAVGLTLALAVLRSGADDGSERLVVVVCVAAAVALKRMIGRTRSARRQSTVLARFCYLLLACSGTVCVASAVLGSFAGVGELASDGAYLAGGGAVCLILAATIDSLFLKARD